MTARRLVLFPAAAFSLAFRLSGRLMPAATELSRSKRSQALSTVRPFGLSGTVDQLSRRARADRAPVSPDEHGSCPSSLPPLASGAGGSSSSRFQQIPLLVGALKALFSALGNGVFLTHPEGLGRGSLNPTLSLHGGVA
jgi:hypothetical protein